MTTRSGLRTLETVRGRGAVSSTVPGSILDNRFQLWPVLMDTAMWTYANLAP
jgi:hypothetical protein